MFSFARSRLLIQIIYFYFYFLFKFLSVFLSLFCFQEIFKTPKNPVEPVKPKKLWVIVKWTNFTNNLKVVSCGMLHATLKNLSRFKELTSLVLVQQSWSGVTWKSFSGFFKRGLVLFYLNIFSKIFYFSYIFIVSCYS